MNEDPSPEMRQWFLDNTWCDRCQAADLGMHSTREYEAEGRTYIEGKCNRYGELVRSEIVVNDVGRE